MRYLRGSCFGVCSVIGYLGSWCACCWPFSLRVAVASQAAACPLILSARFGGPFGSIVKPWLWPLFGPGRCFASASSHGFWSRSRTSSAGLLAGELEGLGASCQSHGSGSQGGSEPWPPPPGRADPLGPPAGQADRGRMVPLRLLCRPLPLAEPCSCLPPRGRLDSGPGPSYSGMHEPPPGQC